MAVRSIVSGRVKPKGEKPLINNRTISALKKALSNFHDGAVLKGEIVKVEETYSVNTSIGLTPRIKIEFKIYMDDGSLRKLVKNFLLIDYPTQPVYQLFMVIFGRTENINLDEMVGKVIGIRIKNSTTENVTYSNIESIFSIDELEDDSDDTVEVVDSDGNIEHY